MISRIQQGILVAASLVACGGTSSQVKPVANNGVPEVAGSAWNRVFVGGATFDLQDSTGQSAHAEVVSVRELGDIRVARLAWTFGTALGLGAPEQVVESPRGMAFFDGNVTDAQLRTQVSDPDFWIFPQLNLSNPEADGPDGQYGSVAMQAGTLTHCYTQNATELCVTADRGLVSLGGRVGPATYLFEAPPL